MEHCILNRSIYGLIDRKEASYFLRNCAFAPIGDWSIGGSIFCTRNEWLVLFNLKISQQLLIVFLFKVSHAPRVLFGSLSKHSRRRYFVPHYGILMLRIMLLNIIGWLLIFPTGGESKGSTENLDDMLSLPQFNISNILGKVSGE